MIVETVERLLDAACDGAAVAAVERGEPAGALWRALADAGIDRAWLPEHAGGIDASVADVCAIVRLAGRFAAPVPLADTLLAGHLLAAAGAPPGGGMLALSPASAGGDALSLEGGALSGQRPRVPFARHAAVLVLHLDGGAGGCLALVAPASTRLEARESLAGEPLDTVHLEGVAPLAVHDLPAGWGGDALRVAGALLRAQAMTGALERILAMSVQYAQEREAFGRPIAKFQAVQQSLAVLAGEVAAAASASDAAMLAAAARGFEDEHAVRAVAAAKIRVGEAAGAGAAIAHQVHGAMGFTFEHRLHQFTRRLWSWRDEYGQESEWAIRLGRLVAAAGPEALWPALTTG
jgi:alkylation response protein AidB-like acyl-CoA dehydrogenase